MAFLKKKVYFVQQGDYVDFACLAPLVLSCRTVVCLRGTASLEVYKSQTTFSRRVESNKNTIKIKLLNPDCGSPPALLKL